MSKMRMRVITLLLCLCMVLSVLPVSAFATDADDAAATEVAVKTGAQTDLFDTSATGGYYNILSQNKYVLCDGATESEIVINNDDASRRQVLHVMEIDPNNTNVEVLPSYYAIDKDLTDSANWSAQIMEKQMDYYRDELGYNVVGGMNTALAYDNEAPYGVMVYNGKVLADGTVHSGAETYLAVIKNEDGTVRFELRSIAAGLKGDEWQAVSANFGFAIKDGILETKTPERTSAPADRSMVGIKADGTLVICQAEGRNAPYAVGLSNYEIGEMMLALGCVWAVNGDGGGSSQFLTKREGEGDYSIRNIPSDGSPRATINGIIIASKIVADGKFDHVAMTAENSYITPGTSIEVSVKGVDASGAAAELPESGLTFAATNGTFENGVFTSNGTVGDAVITAYYNDEVVGSFTVHVVVPTAFNFNMANFVVPYSKSVSLDIAAYYGTVEMVHKASDFTFTLDNNTIGTISGGIFTAVSEEVENYEATVTATLVHNTELTATAGIALGKGSEVLYDFEDQDLHGFYRGTAANYNYNNPAGITSIVTAESGKVHSGDYAMAVEVDFSNSLEAGFQLGSLITEEEIVLEKATSLGMWLYVPDEAVGLRVDSGISGFSGFWSIDGAGATTVAEPGFVYGFEESGWHYISIDVSTSSSLKIAPKTQLLKFYISQKDGKNDYSYGDQTDVNGRYTFYVDDITVDYSSAVDDREAPIFGGVTYATSSMDEGVTLKKDTVADYQAVTVTDGNLSFSATVAENTAKNNYTGINTASGKVYVDGVDYTSGLVWAGSKMSLDVELTDGRHEIKFSVCDNAGNYSSVIREIIVNSVENSPIKVVAHDPNADRILLGSINYIDVVAAQIENVKSVSVTLDLNNISTWYLEHMEVADGFKATYTLTADENIAVITITKVGAVAAAGEAALVSIPVRTWELAPTVAIYGHAGKVWMYPDYKKGYEILPMSLNVETDGGIVTFEDGTTATFTSPKILIMTELSGNAYTSSGSAADNYIRNESWYADWNGGHDHRPETAQYYAEGATNVTTPVALEDKAATCTETGYTGRTYCEVCHSVVDWGTTIPATGHTYSVVDNQLVCECGDILTTTGIVEANDKLYYMINGKLLSGWQTVGSIYCYADPTTLEVQTGEFAVNGITYTAGEDGLLVSGVWVQNYLGKRYSYGPDFYKKQWATIDGKQYYFGSDTYAFTDYHQIRDNENNKKTPFRWFLFGEDGALVDDMKTYNGFLEVNGERYFMEGGIGNTYVGTTRIGDDGLVSDTGSYYYLDDSGKVMTGEQWVGSYLQSLSKYPLPTGNYEFGADGKMLEGVVTKEDGTYYYELGKPVDTGWLKVGEDYYVFTNGGKALMGKQWVGSYLTETSRNPYKAGNFIFDLDGKLANGVVQTDDGWYYCVAGVGKEAGLVCIDGLYYYADVDGKLAIGNIWVGTYPSHGLLPAGYYEFSADGQMLNGVVAKEDGIYYYETGKPVNTGWLKVGEDYYVFTDGGKAMVGSNWVGSYLTEKSRDPYKAGTYYFTEDGKLANGIVEMKDGIYYYEMGRLTDTGWLKVGDAYYVFTNGGKALTGSNWVGTYLTQTSRDPYKAGTYYFTEDGKLANGIVEMEDGIYYYEMGAAKAAGLVCLNNDYYLAEAGGKLATGYVWVGTYASNGLLPAGNYMFGEDGAMLNGFEMLEDGLYYYEKGAAKFIGLKVIDGDLYYIEEGGKVITGTVWVGTYASNGLLPAGNYTFAEDGKFVK